MRAEAPPGWCVATIMDIATTSGGGTPPKADAAYWAGGELPWVSPKDMKRFLVNGSEDAVTTKALERLTLVPTHSVLVVVRSGILSRTLPVAINVIPVTINQDMRAFVPSRSVEPRYVAWQLIANERAILDRCAKDGTTVASIEGPALASHPFAVAPAAEQTRIVDKLEELLSDLDAGVAELKAAQKKLAQYRQSLLKAAVEGRLTEAWRAQHGEPEESGAQLLARILRERRARWEAKQLAKFEAQGKAPPRGWQAGYDEPSSANDTKLPALPSGWTWATLGELTDTLTSGSRDWSPFYDRGTCTFVMAQNVRPWRPDFTFKQLVDPPQGHRDRARSMIRKDDLLVTIVGANTGQACRVDKDLSDHFVCQSVALIRLSDRALSEFVNAVLNSPEHGQRQFREMNYGAGRPHLSFDQLESVLVPLPPLVEQQELLRQLEIAQSLIDGIESQIATAREYCAAQRKNILQAAFSGQLVPQDPTDEPASVLLERIRAERARHGAAKPPRGRKTKESV